MVYALIGTGMRRAALTRLNVGDIDFKRRMVAVVEKGGVQHEYQISKEALEAIKDYLEKEQEQDHEKWTSPALFLSPATNTKGNGRLTVLVVNRMWNEVYRMAGVEGKTPHSAWHAMGKHIMEKTGNIAAVQRQLGHKNGVYSMQYARITVEELNCVINQP